MKESSCFSGNYS